MLESTRLAARTATAALLLLAAASCAGVSTVQRVPVADVAAAVSAERSRAVVFRRDQVPGREFPFVVYDGEREIGRLGAGRHLAWDHAPGRRLLRVVAKRPSLTGSPLDVLIDHRAEAGGTRYYEVRLALGDDERPVGGSVAAPLADELDAGEALQRLEGAEAPNFDEGD